MAQDPATVGTKHRGRFLGVPAQIGPKATHDTDDNGIVVKDVGRQNEPKRALQLDGGRICPQQSLQQSIQPAGRPDQGAKRGSDDHRGHDKGDRCERLEQLPAPKAIVPKDVGSGQGDQQSE